MIDVLSLVRPEWMELAACRNKPTEIFFPDTLDNQKNDDRYLEALIICKRCPVILECRNHAVRNKEIGVWGGVVFSSNKSRPRRSKSGEWTATSCPQVSTTPN